MKIGVFSDIHGNHIAFQAVLSELRQRTDINLLLFLGDLCGYYPFVNDCVDMWPSTQIKSICGNHDLVMLECTHLRNPPTHEYTRRYGSALQRSWELISQETKSFIQSCPLGQKRFSFNSVNIAMFHGTPWNPLNGRVYPDFDEWERFEMESSDIIVLGHTHYAFTKNWHNKLIVNPGSVGQPRDFSGSACYAVINVATGEVKQYRVPYDPRIIIQDAINHDPNNKYLVEVLQR